MGRVKLRIDAEEIEAEAGSTLLEAALAAGIYIPSLCAHPSLAPIASRSAAPVIYRGSERLVCDPSDSTWDGCGLCVVEVEGQESPVRACVTRVQPGSCITTTSEHLTALRRSRLARILGTHPHACLGCAQREGCSRTQCSSNVPEAERCCDQLGSCELQRLTDHIGMPADLPRYRPGGAPRLGSEPLFDWNLELCIGCLRCVRACADLREVGALAFVMRGGRPLVGTSGGPTRRDSQCRFCGACVEVCPTGALADKERARGEGRERALVPCRSSCPAGVDIPRFLRHIARGEPAPAIAVIREKLPFAFAPSYVCFHPCESQCRRGQLDEPISVCRLKRFVADQDDGAWRARAKRLSPTGKKVAVVGSGPAGLTAGYYLAKQGHAVTIYEALDAPGGMLRVGIPEYRYPRALLQRDLDEVGAAGAQFRCGVQIDAAALARLRREHAAVFLATGAQESRKIRVPGTDAPGVYWGVEFLREQALGRLPGDLFARRRVLVIGGGNVAVDAGRVALRLGAAAVRIVSLEALAELPAYDVEVEEARQEGIDFLPTWGVAEILSEHGNVTGILLQRCTRVFDAQGRFDPRYDPSERRREDADAVILAIGQAPSSAAFAECGLNPSGTLAGDPETLATRVPGVFAGGDVVSGPRNVIEAIAMGRRAASAIDKALGGSGDIEERLLDAEPADPRLGRLDGFAELRRMQPQKRAAGERAASFALVEAGASAAEAVAEAARCLRCDLRLGIAPVPLPPSREEFLELNAKNLQALPASEGVYTLLDADRQILAIKGVIDLRVALTAAAAENAKARWFTFEIEPMYSRRESELIQQFVLEHGSMPGGGDSELDDLY